MEVQSICEVKLSTVSVVLQPLFPYACYFTSTWDPAENKFRYLLFLFTLYNCPVWQKHVVVVIFLFFSIVEYTVPERLVSPTGNENKLPGLGSIFGIIFVNYVVPNKSWSGALSVHVLSLEMVTGAGRYCHLFLERSNSTLNNSWMMLCVYQTESVVQSRTFPSVRTI